MFYKLFALVDIIAILAVVASPLLPLKAILAAGLLLLFKGAFFAMRGDVLSLLDVVCGMCIAFLAFGIGNTILLVVVVLFLLQKVFFSMI